MMMMINDERFVAKAVGNPCNALGDRSVAARCWLLSLILHRYNYSFASHHRGRSSVLCKYSFNFVGTMTAGQSGMTSLLDCYDPMFRSGMVAMID
jgi:hypothetical protein